MTGFGTVETAIEAMKKGAYDYILKPFKVEEVIHIVQRGLDRQRLQHENIRLKDALSIYKISEAIATLAGRREGAGPGARRDHRHRRRRRRQPAARGSEEGGPLHRADAQGVGARRAERARRPALNLDEVLPLFREDRPLLVQRQPRLPLHRVAAARSRSPAGQLLQHPAEAEPAHHRHAQRVQLHARQQVQRGPAQDAVRARAAAPRCRSRTRACTRTWSTRTRT